MTPQELFKLCMQKPGAYEDYPFGPDVTIIKVEKKIFAQIFKRNGKDLATLNCNAAEGQFYRQLYPGVIVRGYHCPAVQQPYFNTFPLDGSVPDEIIAEMVQHSYKRVVGRLPKHLRAKLNSE